MDRMMFRGPEPADVIASVQQTQLELCGLLEEIADRMPGGRQAALSLRALGILESVWKSHVDFEENCLFPILRARHAPGSLAHGLLARFQSEHAIDRDIIRKITFALEAMSRRNELFEPAAITYLFRSFFECQRRHIGWESTIIVPLVRDTLDEADIGKMRQWLSERENPLDTLAPPDGERRQCGNCCRGRDQPI